MPEISVSGVYLDEHMQCIGNNENLGSDTVNFDDIKTDENQNNREALNKRLFDAIASLPSDRQLEEIEVLELRASRD